MNCTVKIGFCDTVGECQLCHNKELVTISEHFTVFLDKLLPVKTVIVSDLSQHIVATVSDLSCSIESLDPVYPPFPNA